MADENYIDFYKDEENSKKGIEVRGKDAVILNAPEVLLSPDTPLLTNAQDVAGAINELFSSGGEGGDDWQPPDDWLPVPEPEPYEIYYLVEVKNSSNNSIRIHLADPINGNTGLGNCVVDWGDGNTDTYGSSRLAGDIVHSYPETGQFIVKVTTDEQCCNSRGIYNNAVNVDILICKSGSEIVYAAENSDFTPINWRGTNNISKLHYLKHYGKSTLYKSMFSQCFYLRKVEMVDHPITVIPNNCFENCYALRNIDLSEVTEIQPYGLGYLYGAMLKKISMPKCITVGNYAFYYSYGIKEADIPECKSIGMNAFYYCNNLEKINAPKCDNVGSAAFNACYILHEADFSEDCIFASSFGQCFNLYLHPDGSAY